jgi:hypothetical protein
VNTQSVEIIFQCVFLHLVANFFTGILNKIPKAAPSTTAPIKTLAGRGAGRGNLVGSVETDDSSPPILPPPPHVDANIQIGEVSILVLENLEDADTNALALNVTIRTKPSTL